MPSKFLSECMPPCRRHIYSPCAYANIIHTRILSNLNEVKKQILLLDFDHQVQGGRGNLASKLKGRGHMHTRLNPHARDQTESTSARPCSSRTNNLHAHVPPQSKKSEHMLARASIQHKAHKAHKQSTQGTRMCMSVCVCVPGPSRV